MIGMVLGAGLMRRFQPPPEPVAITPPPAATAPVARAEPVPVYTPVDMKTLPGWTEDSIAQAMPAIRRSCAKFASMAPDAMVGRDAVARPARVWQTACDSLTQAIEGDAPVRGVLERDFTAYHVGVTQPGDDAAQVNDRGTFTGYYEAGLKGALTRGGVYQTPIYRKPRNLVTVNLKDFMPSSVQLPSGAPTSLVGRVDPSGGQVKPYFTRAQIDSENAIAEDADVLLWAEDPVAVHILHIQGSGRVTLPDGQIMRIGFAGHNGRSFRGIGSILLEAGAVKPGGASMVAVREWLKLHPAEAVEYMNRNTRYIFFRKLDPSETEDGPVGALGVSLMPLRSMAVDPRFVPLGAPLWLDTVDPDGLPLQRLMVAQDVGAAITGAVRGDVFWGHGEEAFSKAGRMKSTGGYAVLVPKAPQLPSAQ
jgi:membrane-bound lytic murein transglycosylase A